MKIHYWYENGEQRERVNKQWLGDDLGPVISTHKGADRDNTNGKEQLGRVVVWAFPENARSDRKDQQLLEKPDTRAVIGPRRGMLHIYQGRAGQIRILISP